MAATPLQTAYPPDARAGGRARRIRRLPPTLLVGSAILSLYVLVALTARF